MVATVLAGLATACGAGATAPDAAASPAAAPVESPPAASATTPGTATATPPGSATPAPPTAAPPTESATPRPTVPPPFSAKIGKVSRAEVRYSWHEGCPVSVGDLRKITMTYWGFDDKSHTGELVVNKSAADDLVSVFGKLYDHRYPIRRMESVDVYKGSDYDSIDADNTSAFNCRSATGSSSWSQHAYGLAVDLNPRENPYVYADGSHAHKNATGFVERPLKKPGVVNAGDFVVRTFDGIGWGWGGSWSGAKDFQHFSSNGR
ncbi:Extensin family protein [Microbispora sp. ATCC PTA-5024]|nr:Extensin family protein [Microbispora sp. ATCC PTA-5024]